MGEEAGVHKESTGSRVQRCGRSEMWRVLGGTWWRKQLEESREICCLQGEQECPGRRGRDRTPYERDIHMGTAAPGL